jgi:hypothetical protein
MGGFPGLKSETWGTRLEPGKKQEGKFNKAENACEIHAFPPIAKSAMDGAPSFIRPWVGDTGAGLLQSSRDLAVSPISTSWGNQSEVVPNCGEWLIGRGRR